MLKTPEKRLTIILIAFLIYLLSPVVYGAWLYSELMRGAFPPEADSIAITFAGCVVLWVLSFPFFLFFCGLFELIGRKIYGAYH